MWNNEDDVLSEIGKEIEEMYTGYHDALFDVAERCLKPLYRIETAPHSLKVILDMPFVARKEDLTMTATEMSLNVEAKTKRPVSVLVGGPYQKQVEFEKYSLSISLPIAINPANGYAKFRNGIVVITFPLSKKSHTVKID